MSALNPGQTAMVALFWLLLQSTAGCRTNEPAPATRQPGQATVRDSGASAAAVSAAPESPAPGLHRSVLPGSWYPQDPRELRRLLEDHLRGASPAAGRKPRELVALIVPHAGYAYSARTAACAYRVLQERRPGRILLLGPSHYVGFRGISLGDYRGYETPLGVATVDLSGSEHLRTCPLFHAQPQAHEPEHSLDIQVPFLQVTFPEETPPIIPVLVGRLEEEDYPVLAACLEKLLDDRTVVVVSSDFTHYGPRFQYLPFRHDASVETNLRKLDQGAAAGILALNRKGFLAYRRETGISICGWAPIALLLEMLPGDTHPRELFYETSGKLTGDFRNSVSYFSFGFYRPFLWARTDPNRPEEKEEGREMVKMSGSSVPDIREEGSLTGAEKASLLRLARDTVEAHVRGQELPDPNALKYALTHRLQQKRGAFVTLKKHGDLRGCIGYIQPIEPLVRTVQENAVNACSRDTRFSPVEPEELGAIRIEISALTKPVPVQSSSEIVLGRHGIVLQKAGAKAVFLPQVAPEQGWTLEETLRHLSRKAGLPADAWKDPKTRLSVFSAEGFEEHPHGDAPH